MSAIDILATNASTSACSLSKQLKLNDHTALYIRGFRQLDLVNEFTFEIDDFSKKGSVEEKTCIGTSKFVHRPGTMWDAQEEVFTIKCKVKTEAAAS